VLVVDDELDARELLGTVLELEGAEASLAGSADEAMARLAERAFDVIVCDIGMPEEDGYTFMRRLRAAGEARGGWTPAIAVTGYAGERHDRDAILAGFQMHVAKPVEPAVLVNTIARLWRRRDRAGLR
jgi:CheY-like chemotaxis protein